MIDVSVTTGDYCNKVLGDQTVAYSAHAKALSETGRAYFEKHFGFAAVGVTLDSKSSAGLMLLDMNAAGLKVQVDGVTV